MRRPGNGYKAVRETKPWGHSAAELRRAGRGGNAIAMPPGYALKLLHDWNATRRAAVGAGIAAVALVVLAALVVGFALRFTLQLDGVAAIVGSAVVVLACEGGRRLRFWRVPIALTLIRYRMARA